MFRRFRSPRLSAPVRTAAAVLRDRSGATAVVTALTLTAGLGFAAVAVDLGVGYGARRSAQNAADSAAFSAATAAIAGSADETGQARAVAAEYGFVHGVGGASVIVNDPPTSGAYAGNTDAVEVIVTQPMARFFARFVGAAQSNVRGRSVALTGSAGDGCVLALDRTASPAIQAVGSVDVTLDGCAMFDNSSSATALSLVGNASISASRIGIVGAYQMVGNPTLTVPGGVKVNQKPIGDPYANVPIPAYSGCTYNNAVVNGGATVRYTTSANSPTVFCNGLTLNGHATVTLDPGVYIIDRGTLIVNGNATLRGTGVTLVFTSSTGSNYANVTINGGADVQLSAPTSGDTAGLAYYQDRRAAAGGSNIFNGGATQLITGAIYFPSQDVRFNGGNSTGGGCLQLIADTIQWNGNANLGIECTGKGVKAIGGATTKLVE